MTNRFAGRLSLILIAALVLSIGAPLFAADKTTSLPVSISSVTDAMGSININVGKGEGIKEGSKGVVVRDGKEIASYVVQQVNWGFSRITLLNVVEGYTVRPGDSAPLSGTATEKPSVKKKSSSKTLLTILAIGAAVLLLSGGGGSSNSPEASGDITITTQKTSTSSPGGATGTITITANVNDNTGFAAPDGTAVTFSSTAGTLNRTQATTLAGKATATLSYDLSVDPETATITVRALGKTEAKDVSFVSSIDLVADPLTIEAKDTGTGESVATITATCVDTSGSSTTQSVNFSANLGTIANATVPIGAGGIATTTFSSNTAGTATVTATWGSSKATVTITVTAGPPFSVSVASDNGSIQADGISFATIRGIVKNSKGNPVTDGTVVDFSVIPDADGGGNGTFEPTQATTVGGIAIAYLYSRDSAGDPSKSGTARIKADVVRANQPPDLPVPATDLTNQATVVHFVSSQIGEIHLSADPANVRGWDIVGNTTTITAVVYNTDHQPVPDGTTVRFTPTHGLITGSVSGNLSITSGGIATATLKTDASGNPTWNGLVDIEAIAGPDEVAETAVGVVIFSGGPAASECDANLSQTEMATVGGQAVIDVTALDLNGNPMIDGSVVTVTTDKGTISGGGSGVTSGGQCAFTLMMSTDAASPTPTGPGSVRVTIASGGAGSPVIITLPFTVVAPP